MKIYDINGNELSTNSFSQNMTFEYGKTTNASYYHFRIFKTKADGTQQFPFVYCPDGGASATMSTLQMQERDNFDFAINGGYFDAFQSSTLRPYGITIQNGVLIRESNDYFNDNYHLTIDSNGDLGYAGTINSGVTGASLISQGIKSCILGLLPIVINYDKSQNTISGITDRMSSSELAQRQVVGQYGNGDYAIITCEGRNYDNSDGLTLLELQDLCMELNLKFAMAIDGGGSAETCIGKKQMNIIYEGTKGRIVPTFVVFNGTNTFNVSSNL